MPQYSAADQLYVDPAPVSATKSDLHELEILLTPQETAIALSHLGVWRGFLQSDHEYALVLEDDVAFRRGFAGRLQRAWDEVLRLADGRDSLFDILYLSYEEARQGAEKEWLSDNIFRPVRGLWQLSGYVISRRGAERLIMGLPIQGPVDLWMNLRMADLDVLALRNPPIAQRIDSPSSNAYSILPVLAQLGIISDVDALIYRGRRPHGPLIAIGAPGSGLTSLATALSVLGYRCCSDLDVLPPCELEALRRGENARIFDAYVNVGGLSNDVLREIALANPRARFIFTSPHSAAVIPADVSRPVLYLWPGGADPWEPLSRFLDVDYPAFPYPTTNDIGQRPTSVVEEDDDLLSSNGRFEWDASPWVVPSESWLGIRLSQTDRKDASEHVCERFAHGVGTSFRLRTDTFPSNRALFRKENFRTLQLGGAEIALRREIHEVRDYTAAALCSARRYRFGTFAAILRPSDISGVITGFFLHRNGPRQEIDIEFMGNDTTRMLVNVFYNPGCKGTKLEYGYRGTPTIIDLGFDAVRDFHLYEIDWHPTALTWRVDGRIVHRRTLWQPSPIPHLPMELNVNIWNSRSTKLAGALDDRQLPASSVVREIRIAAAGSE